MIAHRFEELPQLPFALAIGVFDGVHRGHQELIHEMRKTGAPTLILTFSNHPSEILRGTSPIPITPLETKLRLLSQLVDWILVLPFTHKLANTSFEELLDQIPFAHLIIGQGDAFGKDRLGNETNLRAYCQKREINLQIVEKNACSSTLIRKHIQSGNLDEASKLLGYQYSPKQGTPCLPNSPAAL